MKLFLVIALTLATALANDSEVLNKFIAGNHAFASDVYKQLAQKEKGNFLVCPQSAEIILGLTRLGAKGQTAVQLSKSLHLPENNEEIIKTFKEITPTLRGTNKYTLTSANKIYFKNGYQIKEQFKSTAVNVFDAEMENIEFEPKKKAADVMNGWVEDKTHNKIKDLIDPDKLNKDTRAVLINAMYFKGTWKKRFEAKETLKKVFHLDNNNNVMVDSMNIKENFKYYECDELKAKFLEMPYDGEDITMTFVLPNEIEGLSAIENKIHDIFNVPTYKIQEVIVQIPKFKEETQIDFKKVLQNLGVNDLFEDYADLGEFGEPGQVSLKVSDIVQKTFIEVDEKGTTAAAATAVYAVNTYSARPPVPLPKLFIADHPFIYYLSSPSGVMFVGRYVKH